ncbi:MAG: hypothetical protein AAF438_12380 [Pseudomonadota bacterium]
MGPNEPKDTDPNSEEVEDTGSSTIVEIYPEIRDGAYQGPERRLAQRRQGPQDRRQMIRFEPDKAPRRSKDRRKQSIWDGRNEA